MEKDEYENKYHFKEFDGKRASSIDCFIHLMISLKFNFAQHYDLQGTSIPIGIAFLIFEI